MERPGEALKERVGPVGVGADAQLLVTSILEAAPLGKLHRPVEPPTVAPSAQLVEAEEGVGVAGGAVAQSVAFGGGNRRENRPKIELPPVTYPSSVVLASRCPPPP